VALLTPHHEPKCMGLLISVPGGIGGLPWYSNCNAVGVVRDPARDLRCVSTHCFCEQAIYLILVGHLETCPLQVAE